MSNNNNQHSNAVKLYEKGSHSFYYVPYIQNGTYKIKKFLNTMGKEIAYKSACDFSLSQGGQVGGVSMPFTSFTHIPFIIRFKMP